MYTIFHQTLYGQDHVTNILHVLLIMVYIKYVLYKCNLCYIVNAFLDFLYI